MIETELGFPNPLDIFKSQNEPKIKKETKKSSNSLKLKCVISFTNFIEIWLFVYIEKKKQNCDQKQRKETFERSPNS